MVYVVKQPKLPGHVTKHPNECGCQNGGVEISLIIYRLKAQQFH